MQKKIITKKENCKSGKNKEIDTSFIIEKNKVYTVKQLVDWWQLKTNKAVLNAIRKRQLKAFRMGNEYKILGSWAIECCEKLRVYKG